MKFTNTQTFLDIEHWTSTTLVKNCYRNFRTIFEKLDLEFIKQNIDLVSASIFEKIE